MLKTVGSTEEQLHQRAASSKETLFCLQGAFRNLWLGGVWKFNPILILKDLKLVKNGKEIWGEIIDSSLLSSDVHPTDFVIKVLLQICLVVVDQKVNHSNVSAPSTFCAFQPVKALRIAKPFVVCCWFATH